MSTNLTLANHLQYQHRLLLQLRPASHRHLMLRDLAPIQTTETRMVLVTR
jgi:hypothetical protein